MRAPGQRTPPCRRRCTSRTPGAGSSPAGRRRCITYSRAPPITSVHCYPNALPSSRAWGRWWALKALAPSSRPPLPRAPRGSSARLRRTHAAGQCQRCPAGMQPWSRSRSERARASLALSMHDLHSKAFTSTACSVPDVLPTTSCQGLTASLLGPDGRDPAAGHARLRRQARQRRHRDSCVCGACDCCRCDACLRANVKVLDDKDFCKLGKPSSGSLPL